MTSGVISIGSNPNTYSRTWSGKDGKYRTLGDIQIINEHNYSNTTDLSKGTKNGIQQLPAIAIIDYGFPNSVNIKLQHKLFDKVKHHSFDLGKFVAEGKDTVGMIGNTAITLARTIHLLKRGRFRDAADQLGVGYSRSGLRHNDIAGRWLELQYGWLPLLSDVHSAADAVAVHFSKPRTSQVRVSNSYSQQYNGGGSSVVTNNTTFTYKRSIIYNLSESDADTSARNLGLENPLGIAWELVPYSFVIDWFLPIGAYLDNLSNIPKLTGKTVTTNVRSWSGSSYCSKPPPHLWSGLRRTRERRIISRVVSTGLSVSGLGFTPLHNTLSPTRFWNAIALASQLLKH